MKKAVFALLVLMMVFSLTACQSGFIQPDAKVQNPTAQIQLEYTDANDGLKTVTLQFELRYDKAPITVLNFVKLANEKYYDGLMIDSSTGLGSSSSFTTALQYIGAGKYRRQTAESKILVNAQKEKSIDYKIKGEFAANGYDTNDLKNAIGALVMNRTSGPKNFDTASTEFYISLNAATTNNGNYAVFGQFKSMSGTVQPVDAEEATTYEEAAGFYDWFLADMLAMSTASRKLDDGKSVTVPSLFIAITSVTVDTHGATLPNPPTVK